jgi:hypothetical protein
VCLALLTISCEHSPSAPSTASAVAPAVRSLDITDLEDGGAVGAPMQATALATLADGTRLPFTAGPAWTSSNPDVARVDATGRITPLSEGTTTIGASVKGAESSELLTVVMNLEGGWEFQYLATDCRLPLVSFGCLRFDGPTPKTAAVTVTQHGRRLTLISGSVDHLFAGIDRVDGEIAPDRSLRLSGESCHLSDPGGASFRVRDWQMVPDGGMVFAGQLHWQQTGFTGNSCDAPGAGNTIGVDVRVWNFPRAQR